MRLANRGRLLLRTSGPVAFVLMLEPFSLELVMFSDFEFRTSLGTTILLDNYFITQTPTLLALTLVSLHLFV